MGFSEKPPQSMEGGFESDGKKWVIAGISLRAQLKPVRTTTNSTEKEQQQQQRDSDDGEECSTTPTAEEARIPTKLTCPPAPRKRKPVSRCNYSGVREFFTPPDLETVFIRHVERAN